MSDNIIEIIPSNPPVGAHNSKRYRDAVAENTHFIVLLRAASGGNRGEETVGSGRSCRQKGFAMVTLTKKLDAAIDRLQDVHDAAADADKGDAATRLEEIIETLREIDFSEENDEEGDRG